MPRLPTNQAVYARRASLHSRRGRALSRGTGRDKLGEIDHTSERPGGTLACVSFFLS